VAISKSAHSRVDKHTYSADIENDCVVFTSVAISKSAHSRVDKHTYSADIENGKPFSQVWQ